MTMNLGSGSSAPPRSPAGLANIGKTSTCHTKREEREVAVTTMMLRGLGAGVEPIPTTTRKRVLV